MAGSMMKRIINFSIFHPYWIITCVTLITVFFAFQLPHLKIDPRVEIILKENNPVEKDYSLNKEEFAPYADILIGMLHSDIYAVDSLNKIHAISQEAMEIKGVRKVTSILNAKNIQGSISGLEVSPIMPDGSAPSTLEEIEILKEKAHSWDVYEGVYITPDGKGTAISIVLDDDVETDQIVPIYYDLSDIMKKYEGPEQFFISGTKVVEALQGHYMIKDLKLLPPLVCIVLLSFMFVFFRNIRGMLLPLTSVGIATTWSVGMMPLLDIPLTMVTTALPVALMGVGVAYGVHGVENVFSDAAEGKRGKAGISGAINRIAIPVIMAGCTTMACFLSLCSTPVVPLSHFGMLCAFGIAVAMMLSLTFIPAAMSIIDSRGKQYVPHHHTKKDIIGPLLKRISYINIHKTWWVIVFYLVVFVVSIALGRHVKSDLNLIEDFRESSPIRVADEILNENFGGTSLFNAVFSTGNPDDIKEPAVLKEMEQLQERFKEHPDIGKAVSIVDFIKKMNQAMHDGDPAFYTIPESRELIAQYLLLFSFSGGDGELESFVDYDYQKAQILLQMKSQSGYLANDIVDIVEEYRENELGQETITGIITTGMAMLAKEFNRLVVRSQVQSFLISISLCFLITSVLFRSYKLALYSLVPLIIPIALDFGIMGVTGIKLNAATATVASIDIGMGVDYSIHFLSRYRHEIRMGRTVTQALDIALNTSGRAIIYNALAVAAGFLVLVPSQFVIVSQLGLLVAIDMLTISVSVLTFLPASIKLLPPSLLDKLADVPKTEVKLKLVTPAEQVKGSSAVLYRADDKPRASVGEA